jgi:hypothetical protein
MSGRDVSEPLGHMEDKRVLHTNPVDLGDLLAVVQAFNSLYLHGDEDVVVGGGSVFSWGLSEDCRGEGRTDTPDT